MLQAEAFDTIQESLKQLLHDDAKSVKGYSASCIQRCFAIKSEMHVLLDLARKTYCELVDEITRKLNWKWNTLSLVFFETILLIKTLLRLS